MAKFNTVEVVVGAGVGGALGLALDVLREVVEKHLEFDPTLEIVKSTLDSLALLIPQVEFHNNALGGNRAAEVEKLKDEMRDGEVLINELLKVNDWSCWKACYTDQLVELEESLKRHLSLLLVQGVVDGKATLVVARDISENVKEISTDVKENTRCLKDIEENTNKIAGLCAQLEEMIRANKEMNGQVQNQVETGWVGVTKPPPFTVGFESQVDELKKKLLEAKSVCQDKEVKDKYKIIFVNVSQRSDLVLDNVWPGNRTASLLASCKFKESEKPNNKILVTSRSDLAGFDFDVKHPKENLNEKDATSLLRNSAGLTESSSIPEDLQRKFEKFRLILGEEDAIVDIKECFKDLASFPQGRRIPASVLIDMQRTDNDSSCIAILYKLTYWSLANVITWNDKGDMDDYCGDHFVTQHYLLRELAIHHTDEGPIEQRKRLIIDIRGNKFPKWWKKQMDRPFKEAHLVSISTDSHFSSKWRDIQLPKAKVLVLNSHTKNYRLPKFVKKMEKLKVLIVTNEFLPAEVSNFSLLGSLSELKTIRLERISISSITKNPIELRRLQKISFFMCNMGPAFSKYSIKFFEAFPELQEINIDYCSDLVELPADICLLIHLKKLSITNCHKLSALPEMIGHLVNLELLRLRSCTDLSEFPGSVTKLEKLKVLDISNCYGIKELPEYIGEMRSLKNLDMRMCLSLDEPPESISDLEKLTDVICDRETESLW